jgi:hypothetical protein
VVTCVTCHNGSNLPATIRKLDAVYNTPTTDEPAAITQQAPGAPSAEQVLDKYIAAIGGGAHRLAKLTTGRPGAPTSATPKPRGCRSRFTHARRRSQRGSSGH